MPKRSAPADFPRYDETTTAWSSAAGITDAYLTVRDIPATVPVGSAEGDVTVTPVAAPSGQAWPPLDRVQLRPDT
jgi:hypothetical protein